MPRALTPSFITQASAAANTPVILFQGVFKTSTLRLWNGVGDLVWNGGIWLGNGWLQGIEGATETPEVEATTMAILLSGIPAATVSLILNNQRQGAEGHLHIGFLDEARQVVDSPYLWWMGRFSHAEIDDRASEAQASLIYTSPLVDMERPREYRWNHVTQKRFYPEDRGFRYIRAAAKWNGNWGGKD